jgi:hypothetical protein
MLLALFQNVPGSIPVDVTKIKTQTTTFLSGINTTYAMKKGVKPNPGTSWLLETCFRQRMDSAKHNISVVQTVFDGHTTWDVQI